MILNPALNPEPRTDSAKFSAMAERDLRNRSCSARLGDQHEDWFEAFEHRTRPSRTWNRADVARHAPAPRLNP